MKRATVAGYVGAAAYQMEKGVMAAAQSEAMTEGEVVQLVKAWRLMRALADSLKKGKR